MIEEKSAGQIRRQAEGFLRLSGLFLDLPLLQVLDPVT